MLRLSISASLLILASLTIAIGSGVFDDEDAKKLARGQELMASGDFKSAAEVLGGIETNPAESGTALQAALLRCRALLRANEPSDSAEAARRLMEGLRKDSPGRGRAHFLVAEAFEAMGKRDEAARVYAAEAAKVLGEGHRARVAGYYLSLAHDQEQDEKSTDPLKPGRKADPARAASMYGKALEILTGGKPKVDVTIPRCRNLVAAGKAVSGGRRRGPNHLGVAANELKALLDSKTEKLSNAQQAEARYLRADALAASRRPAEALTELGKLLEIESVTETPYEPKGLVLQGQTLMAVARTKERMREGVAAWRTYLKRFPDREEAADVRQRIARAWFDAGESEEAITAYGLVANDKKAKGEARALALFRVAESMRRLQRFDASREAFRRYLAAWPDDGRVPEAQALVPELLLEKARALRKLKNVDGSVAALRQYVAEYPLSRKAASVSVEIGLVLRERKKIADAAAAFLAARDRYRNHDKNQAARAGFLLGVVEEEDRKDLEAAAKAYHAVLKTFRGTAAARAAQERVSKMEAIELALAVPKIYAPGDRADVSLTVRNVKDASFRLYRLDARDYFERRGSLDGAANIEVALVKSDRSWTWKPKAYERYRRDQLDVKVELEKDKTLPEGAWLVAVEAEQRRSVVLVLVSSVRIVVKQSPYELFCWATDAKTGEPREGVEILVRGGLSQTMKTGKDGVARQSTTAAHGNCQVLGLLGDAVAPGLAKPNRRYSKKGLAPRVAFTLDRPIYRPGDRVRYRAVLRQPQGGRFVTPKKVRLPVRFLAPDGRSLAEQQPVIGAYGIIHGSFQLPPEGSVGDHVVEVSFANHTFRETVPVRAYKKPEYRVQVKPKQRVVRPGEEIDVGVDVQYYFGGPVREGTFEWRVWQAPHQIDRERYQAHSWYLRATETQRTPVPAAGMSHVGNGSGSLDAKGKGRFTFRAPMQDGSRRFVIQVFVRDSAGAPVTGTGLVYAGNTDRFGVVLAAQRTYRAGDRAEVRVVTADPGYQGVATQGRLLAMLKRVGADGRTTLERVAEAAVDTGLPGEATVNLVLEKAGDYVLRFEGKDAREAPIVAETAVVVTGERPDLATEALLRFEKEVYRGGETARMHLSVPTPKRPVLVTFEGERVLRYEILRPEAKSQVHEVTLAEDLAPNVVVACALPHGDGLLTSQDEIVVLRYLQVSVAPAKRTAGPKEKVKLRVQTRDQLGRPVPAAVAVRVSDGALAQLGGNAGQDPRFVFNKDVRAHLVTTGSSFAFRFKGATRFLDKDLVNLENDKMKRELGRKTKALDGLFALAESLDEASESDAKERFGAPADDPAAAPMGNAANRSGRGRRGSNQPAKPGAPPPIGGGSANRRFAAGYEEAKKGLGEQQQSGQEAGQGGEGLAFRESLKRAEQGGKDYRVWAQANKSHGLLGKAVNGQGQFFNLYSYSAAVEEMMVQPELRQRFLEVAGWWPDLVTNARGEATVTLDLPDNLTTWDVLGAGAGKGSAVGQGGSSIKVSQDVVLRIERPRFLTSRDEVGIASIVHSHLDETIAFRHELRSNDPAVLQAVGMTETSFELGPYGVARRNWRFRARGAGLGTFEANALSSKASDAVKRGLPVLAFGQRWVFADTMELVDEAAFRFNLDHEPVSGSQNYSVIVQAGMEADVLDGVRYLVGYPYGCLEQSLNRFLPAMLLAEARSRAGLPPLLDRARLAELVKTGIVRLAAYQRNDGGFSYWPKGASDPWVTAMCLETLLRVRDHRHVVPSALLSSGWTAARRMLQSGRVSLDARAALLLACVRGGDDQRATLNAVFRERQGLSVQGLSRLLLACHRAGRPEMVRTMFGELKSRRTKVTVAKRHPFSGRLGHPWLASGLEASALALLAYQAAGAGPAETESLVKAVREGVRRRSGGTKAVALGIEALTDWVVATGGLRSAGNVRVMVDGKEVASGSVGGETPVLALSIPIKAVGKGEHRVVVQKRGGIAATCRLVLRNVKPVDRVPADGNIFTVQRRVVAYRDPDAKTPSYAPGHDIVRVGDRPRPVPAPGLDQAIEGSKVTVELKLKARESASYVVLEEPQIAGFEVIESGVRGSFDRFERRDTHLLFFKDRVRKGEEIVIRYPAYAVYQGRFTSLPARAEEMYAPERWGRSGSGTFHVVGDASMLASVAPRKPTPDELYAMGNRAFDTGKYEETVALFTPLLEKWPVRENIHDHILARLLVSYLRLERWPAAVKTRDELRLRNPGKERLGKEDRERLGRAYLSAGDPWAARGHFQWVVLDGFSKELEVCDAYRSLGQSGRAVSHLLRTMSRYPAVGEVVVQHASVASWLLKEQNPKIDPKRAHLLPPLRRVRSVAALSAHRSVMAWHSGSKIAENANWQRIEILRGLDEAKLVERECRLYLSRHAYSGRADAVTFFLAAALFTQERYEDAAKEAKAVWEKRWERKTNSKTHRYQSSHRWPAGYLMGRIAHVDGRYEDAVTWYGRVRGRVADAQQSWLFFTEKELAVDPLVSVKPGSEAKVPYRAKNLDEVKALVYPVDLGVLFAVKKSFDRLNTADLAGIRPAQEVTSKTNLEKYRRGSASCTLGKKTAGAYLVVLRAGPHTATTLMVVTDARLTVQRSNGAVRVYLVDAKGKPLADAQVKLGVAGRIFHSGTTDERGMLDVRDPGRGKITVVAEKSDTVAVGTHN